MPSHKPRQGALCRYSGNLQIGIAYATIIDLRDHRHRNQRAALSAIFAASSVDVG